MNRILLTLSACALITASSSAADYAIHSFSKQHLDKFYWSEGAAFGDLNRDGKADAICGPYWWEGPTFEKRHEIYPPTKTFKLKQKDGTEKTIPGFVGALGDRNGYSTDNFFAFTHDLNGDGWNDVLTYGLPHTPAYLYVNPKGKAEHWKRHTVFGQVDNESPTFADITGDGKPEIICNFGGNFGYAEPDWKNPTTPWKFHAISEKGNWQRYTHGLGIGDINGDGRQDFLFKSGWWEQPTAKDGKWTLHPAMFSPGGGAQMYAYDVNGDGRNDVITGIAAHGYGLAWHEQLAKKDKNGHATFKMHIFMNKERSENKYGVQFSQLHAVELFDVDGDGLKDIVTGKTFWAHGPGKDPDPGAAPVIYWFQLVRDAGKVDFIPHLIDNNSGVGRQIGVADFDGNGLQDLIIGNKKGTFVFAHKKKSVSKADWQAAQPKVFVAQAKPATAAKPTGEIAFAKPAGSEGILPTGKDGKPLNLDFESGTLKDWTVAGRAFEQQPVKGGIDQNRPFGEGKKAERQGRFWLGGYEKLKDRPKGTIESVPFKVTHDWATFRVGGGNHPETRVELVNRATGKVFYTARGRSRENMLLAVVDLRKLRDKEISVRVVDDHSGGWGHVNFDDFRFHRARPSVQSAAAVGNRPAGPELPPLDIVKNAGLSPANAIKELTLPKGFSATMFAAEPDVKQPIAFCIDDRGRLWVAESYTYPIRQPEGKGNDRILILEDTTGDGVHDKRTVFKDNLNLVSGIEVGFGGVFVGSAPQFLFIPDKNGDDKPDSKPEVLLDGWGYQDTHETLNTFCWGPDGWLYGCHGVFTHSKVGKPGTPDDEREPVNAAVWRYHPTKDRFETFAYGTSNPWGVDFNDYGQCLIEACVIPHFFHMIQGARYQRQGGKHFNPYTYDDIKTIADHLHYLGARPHTGNARSDKVGGGHAHAGLMVYLGGSWPDKYRGMAFMNNIHGSRINMDIPVRKGSGYVGKHGADLMNFNDQASQIVNLLYDQDGSVFMIDWYDLNQCHRRDPVVHDRSNGRIFKVAYGNQKTTRVDLKKASDDELVKYQLHKNDWYVRHARRVLQERGSNPKVHKALLEIANNNPDETRKLRALWALHVTGGFTEKVALAQLKSKSEYVRAWAIQLAFEDKNPSDALLKEVARMAADDKAPFVRLYIAAAMLRTPIDKRRDTLVALLSHAEDADDHNLPLMYWYAAEPLVGKDTKSAVMLLGKTKIAKIRTFITRRMTAGKQAAAK